jgi:hypothetical protein
MFFGVVDQVSAEQAVLGDLGTGGVQVELNENQCSVGFHET